MTDQNPPRISVDPKVVQMHGLDGAIVAALESEYAAIYDEGLISGERLRGSVALLQEVLHGGPLMEYFATARREAGQALTRLVDINPSDAAAVIELQEKARSFQRLIEWIEDYISADRALRPDSPMDLQVEEQE